MKNLPQLSISGIGVNKSTVVKVFCPRKTRSFGLFESIDNLC